MVAEGRSRRTSGGVARAAGIERQLQPLARGDAVGEARARRRLDARDLPVVVRRVVVVEHELADAACTVAAPTAISAPAATAPNDSAARMASSPTGKWGARICASSAPRTSPLTAQRSGAYTRMLAPGTYAGAKKGKPWM